MKHGDIELLNMDCMELLCHAENKRWDLAIVDPPFGIGNKHNRNARHKNHGTYTNNVAPGPEYFTELRRVSKYQIIWGCQYYMEQLNPEGSFIIWDKKADPDLHNMSSADVAWYSKRERIRTFDGHWCGAVKFTDEPTIHIHQKPTDLYKWILKHYAQPGFNILDTHAGSFSIGIACHDYGFALTACELDKDYYEAACKRFRNHIAQQKLFV